MKLRIIAVLLVIVFVLAGCGPKNNTADQPPANNTQTNSTPQPNNNQAPNTNQNTNQNPNTNNAVDPAAEQKKKDQEKLDAIYASGISSSDDLQLFLDGTWQMMPVGALPGTEPPYLELSFNRASSEAVITVLAEDKPKVSMNFSTGKLFDNAYSSEDLIFLDVLDTSEIIKKNTPMILGTHNEFQIIACRLNDDDFIAIREIGNGTSYLALEVLNTNNLTGDGFWVFVRDGGTRSSVKQDEQFSMNARYKNGSFFALRWIDYLGSCYLMPVNVEVYEDTFWVDKVSVIRFAYSNNGVSLSNVFYDIEGIDSFKKEPVLNPQLVEVKVDEQGQITNIADHPYYSYGVYSTETVIHDPGYEDFRDPTIYGRTDETFLGKWRAKDGSGVEMTVSEASLQTGGYRFDIKFSDADSAECYANISEEDLIVNQGYVNGTYDFECALMKTNTGIQLLVTSSKWDKMPSGATIDFVKN